MIYLCLTYLEDKKEVDDKLLNLMKYHDHLLKIKNLIVFGEKDCNVRFTWSASWARHGNSK